MPLSQQERRCVDLGCQYLAKTHGGSWAIEGGRTLDDLNPGIPSPEVLVTNGTVIAAIEVKRLTGGSVMQEYMESVRSLRKRLLPSTGGRFYLCPWIDFKLPMGSKLFRHVRREIERLAPSMPAGDKRVIRIPRKAHVSMANRSGPGYIFCGHSSGQELLRGVLDGLGGSFFLVDMHLNEHQFLTEEAEIEFKNRLRATCENLMNGGSGEIEWYEEWELGRYDDDGEDGVDVVAATRGIRLQDAATECVGAMVEKTLQKFKDRRWADLHVLILEKSDWMMKRHLVTAAVSDADPGELGNLDLVLLVDGDDVLCAWPPSSSATDMVEGSDSDTGRAAGVNEARTRLRRESADSMIETEGPAHANTSEPTPLMEQPLDLEKVAEFQRDYLRGWGECALLRRLLREAETLAEVHEPIPDGMVLGFWQIGSKGAFVANAGNTVWIHPGWDFGTGMAQKEDDEVLAAIRRSIVTRESPSHEPAADVRLALRQLREGGYLPDAILFSGLWDVLWQVTQDRSFEELDAQQRSRNRYFFGVLDGVPVYVTGVNDDAEESEFLIVDFGRLIHLRQFVTEAGSPWREFSIRDYSLESAQEVAAGDRRWLPDEIRNRPENEVVHYLRERVAIRIKQLIEVQIDDRRVAIRLVMRHARDWGERVQA